MKIFSPEKIKIEGEKKADRLAFEKVQLEKQVRDLQIELQAVRGQLNADKSKIDKTFKEFVQDINAKKSNLLKELLEVERQLEKKKDLFYGLVEKQDTLRDREIEVSEKEENLRRREVYVRSLEGKIAELSHV